MSLSASFFSFSNPIRTPAKSFAVGIPTALEIEAKDKLRSLSSAGASRPALLERMKEPFGFTCPRGALSDSSSPPPWPPWPPAWVSVTCRWNSCPAEVSFHPPRATRLGRSGWDFGTSVAFGGRRRGDVLCFRGDGLLAAGLGRLGLTPHQPGGLVDLPGL